MCDSQHGSSWRASSGTELALYLFFLPTYATSSSTQFFLSLCMDCLKTAPSSFQSQLIILFQHQKYILWYGQNFIIMSKYSYPETEKMFCGDYKIARYSEIWFLLFHCSMKLFISLKIAVDSLFIPWLHLAQSLSIASFLRFDSYHIILEIYLFLYF